MDPSADYSRQAGGAALAARLRRLAERVDREASRLYATQDIRFEQRWYGLINQLVLNGPMSIGDIGRALHITHVSVSQASRSLEAAGIIQSAASAADARRRELRLTARGKKLVAQLAPLWQALNAVGEELNAEAGDVVRLLDRLDDALERQSLFDRVAERLGLPLEGSPD
jgi:MarR family transcriptional regulator, organic hydroperoxide resistance regulator